jgi:hypothetical protein
MTDEMRKHIGYLPEDYGQTFSTSFACLTASSRLIAVTGGGDRWKRDVPAPAEMAAVTGWMRCYLPLKKPW